MAESKKVYCPIHHHYIVPLKETRETLPDKNGKMVTWNVYVCPQAPDRTFKRRAREPPRVLLPENPNRLERDTQEQMAGSGLLDMVPALVTTLVPLLVPPLIDAISGKGLQSGSGAYFPSNTPMAGSGVNKEKLIERLKRI